MEKLELPQLKASVPTTEISVAISAVITRFQSAKFTKINPDKYTARFSLTAEREIVKTLPEVSLVGSCDSLRWVVSLFRDFLSSTRRHTRSLKSASFFLRASRSSERQANWWSFSRARCCSAALWIWYKATYSPEKKRRKHERACHLEMTFNFNRPPFKRNTQCSARVSFRNRTRVYLWSPSLLGVASPGAPISVSRRITPRTPTSSS